MFPADTFRQLTGILRTRISAFILLSAALCVCFALVGCSGDYCIIGIFNPTGTVTGTTNPCVNNKLIGNISFGLTSAAASADAPMAPNLLHIFVTVQGIEAHPNAMAPEDSPDWEELAPELVREPMQIDLLAHPTNSCATNRVPAAAVAAGSYRQLRLRLASNRTAAGDALPGKNACGELGFHCAVSPDGHVHPLAFDGGVTALRVGPDRISGGFFHVLPDSNTHLTIEFNRFASFAASAGDAVQLTPVFTVETAASCGATAASAH